MQMLPPEMTILALARSGRSLLDSSCLTNSDLSLLTSTAGAGNTNNNFLDTCK